jgi:hypothetical protein
MATLFRKVTCHTSISLSARGVGCVSYISDHGRDDGHDFVLRVGRCQVRVLELNPDGEVSQFEQLDVPVIGKEPLCSSVGLTVVFTHPTLLT